ncbi:TOMM precursor leader peptide-binding protein [Sphaerimonospora sp. CA-214678]|uniref:TOMM precursor leader peptide-binding protein n=1 Tax=Sphaerimonospora sp. CA-214678 TaxID=3240029 RepID=UPI003D8AED33
MHIMTERAEQSETLDTDLSKVRPRIRHDVLFADTGGGVLLRDGDGGFFVKGSSAYRLATMLIPYLTGEHTVAELSGGLSEPQQKMVSGFVRALLERGFARDAQPSGSDELSEAVRERFASQINYVDHYTDDAARRFAAFRTARILVCGGGPVALAAALSLVRNGSARVDVVGGSAHPALLEEAEALTSAGCGVQVNAVQVDSVKLDGLTGYDVIIAAAGDCGPAELLRLSALRGPDGPALLSAAVVGRHAVLGPLARAGSPCWGCAMLRLDANLDPALVAAMWRDAGLPGGYGANAHVSAPVASMIGNMLGYETFRLLTGAATPETDGALIIQDLNTLETVTEPLLPHPRCPVCVHDDIAPDIPRPLELTEPEEDAAVEPGLDADTDALREELDRVLPLVGPNAGVFSSFEDLAIDQSPLKLSRLRVGVPDAVARQRVIAAADLYHLPRARVRAAHQAALVYAGRIGHVSDARASSGLELAAEGLAPVGHHRLLTASGMHLDPKGIEPWVQAVSLLTGRAHLVPAAAVHPFSRHNTDLVFEPSAAGDGAGATLAQAAARGLLSALGYAAMREVVAGRAAGTAVLDPPEHGSEMEFLLRTVRNMELSVELLSLAPAHTARTVLARATSSATGEEWWAIGTGVREEAAAKIALRDLVARAQLRRELGLDEELDFGDPLMATFDAFAVRTEESAVEPPNGDMAEVLKDLAADELDPLLVQTTPPDLGRNGGIVTVRVLLARQRWIS